jgi:outer membrane protein OmpA-like peptidoglycan-associated protein
LLSGHTDNVGKPETNMNLSKNRTMAVKDYLIKKGIDESKIKTEWFGHTKPIADNSTADGRQRNRRVEMKLYFD